MPSYMDYDQLNAKQLEWVKANFDGRFSDDANAYYYELGLNGQVICRHRKEKFDDPANFPLSPDAMRGLTGEFPCPHAHTVVESRGSMRFVNGDVDDDLTEVLVCTDCGKEWSK